ncbi:diacylglycerol/lipid kinase family protein [Pajaroellobacter abortibovis]|uniref:DAGKc domain-containing protein n=1 Tax=Pajaroellobacter abortibovis TaxID=1882918 RepID=A0A1L6MXD5_9BACT|nr:diacylglycerol kinase family protein [Pajaroellobacter abortibovis]APS00095.1 hypothetical protein BCY86_04930 [Pajaroellobacter abortibovis]
MKLKEQQKREKPAGAGFAILVNANAKRGGKRFTDQLRAALPAAHVCLTNHPEEIEQWICSLPPCSCIFSAGGDGSIIALLNVLHHLTPPEDPLPPVGIIPLGTGNAWGHVTGAPSLRVALSILSQITVPLFFQPFGLIEWNGQLTHFAGSGWDAQILQDFQSQLAISRGFSRHLSQTVVGYLSATLFRTFPKVVLFEQPHGILENTGNEVYTIQKNGGMIPLKGIKEGSILYEGPISVAGAATCPELGYHFRAYPFANRIKGLMNVRIYNQSPVRALLHLPHLWRGTFPLAGIHDWFVKSVRFTFSRPVPFQIAGDPLGNQKTVEYHCSSRTAPLLDWRPFLRRTK